MILCLDVGNTQLYGGLFKDNTVVFRFRRVMNEGISSDEIGIFLRSVIRENGYDPSLVSHVAYCSVVPDLNHSLENSCRRYFNLEPFALKPGVKTGLKIKYNNPSDVGSDRIADAIGAYTKYPDRNIIIVDFGTATTIEVLTKEKEYLGGAIVPGLKIAMQALEERTARLPKVEIIKAVQACGRTTIESIQSGLYYGHVGLIREITEAIIKENFKGERPLVIGTGGFSSLFSDSGLFDEIIPDLVLDGIYKAQELNR
ncbi:MAG: type III pantothenate kinase [Sphaerochaeta sp.]|jgi:type III pantothenate kinase